MSVTLLEGPNTYAAHQALRELIGGYAPKHPDVTVERIDAGSLEPSDLPGLLQGVTLFAENRFIVLSGPSAHKALWNALEGYVDKVADTTTLVIVDPAVDKRTKTYKAIQKNATVKSFPESGQKDVNGLSTWLISEASRSGLVLSRDGARLVIERAGYDGWALMNALEKLLLVDDASPSTIRDLIEPLASSNAFEIFEDAVRGRVEKVRLTLTDLRSSQDPHALVGLLTGQAFQLALVANSHKSPADLAKLVGGHPYPLQKMGGLARSLSRVDIARIVDAMVECDRDLKHSVAGPWVLIERALVKIAVT